MSYKSLKNQVESCTLCPLSETRNHAVIGEGVLNAKVVIVGEAPGAQEDLIGKPFVGKSGNLLDQLLEEAGFYRGKNIYITSINKCRPPENRDPTQKEVKACLPFLWDQLKIIQPEVIVCLGRIAAQTLIDKKLKVTQEHGNFYKKDGFLYMPTIHPAAVLRTPSLRPVVQKDLETLNNKLKDLEKRA